MITFSILSVTSFCIVAPGRDGHASCCRLLAPSRDRLAQLEVRDRAGDRRQPEREARGSVRTATVARPKSTPKAANAPIMPPSTPPDAAGQRQQVAEHPDEVAHDQHAPRRRLAERVEARPQHGDVEAPEGERPDAAPGPSTRAWPIASRTPADVAAGTVARRWAIRASRGRPWSAAQSRSRRSKSVGTSAMSRNTRDRRRRRAARAARSSPTAPGPTRTPQPQAEPADRPARAM